MSNKTNGQSQIEDMFSRASPEFKERWYEIMFGKDGKSGAIKEPYAHYFEDLIPEGVKLLKLIPNKKLDK